MGKLCPNCHVDMKKDWEKTDPGKPARGIYECPRCGTQIPARGST